MPGMTPEIFEVIAPMLTGSLPSSARGHRASARACARSKRTQNGSVIRGEIELFPDGIIFDLAISVSHAMELPEKGDIVFFQLLGQCAHLSSPYRL
mgnify:CR=1 FL=1